MTRTFIVAEYRTVARTVVLEKVLAQGELPHYRVTKARRYSAIDQAKQAYLREIPESGRENQEKNIKNGLRFADERQNTPTNTNQRKGAKK